MIKEREDLSSREWKRIRKNGGDLLKREIGDLPEEAKQVIIETLHDALQTTRFPKVSNAFVAGCLQTEAEQRAIDGPNKISDIVFEVAEKLKVMAEPRTRGL